MRPIAALAAALKPDLVIVDSICGDLDFEEGGNPVVMNRMMGLLDPVLCDSYVCDLMGYKTEEVPYIGLAEELGVGCSDTSAANIIVLDPPESVVNSARSSRRIQRLEGYISQKDACSACYGNLIHALNRLEEENGTRYLKDKICIGQGYKGCGGTVGVGVCTRGFSKTVIGCPPKAIDIYDFLKNEVLR